MFRTFFRLSYMTMFVAGIFMLLFPARISADTMGIQVLRVNGTIVPVIVDYIDRGISQAEAKGNTLCIIELNTPGGLLDSTEKIVQRILNAKVPVVVYVYPGGSWAASAGTFITISAHIAAMAPGTTIGAAHPVSVGENMPAEVQQKATEYSAAWIKSIAEIRKRDQVQAELAVKESKSFTAPQALENHLIDYIAADLDSLVQQINGKKIVLANNQEVTVDVSAKSFEINEMNWTERFLQAISNPNVAYILLSLATIGLITEISSPGLIFPGVIGGICLFIAFYSLGTLNAYWAGVLLIILAFGLFVAELFVSAFGILTAGGLASLILGSLILFANNPPALTVNTGLIIVVAVVIAAFVILVVGAVVRGQRRKITTGVEGLIGRVAIAKTKLDPKGNVLVEGELWAATIDEGTIESGEEVTVTGVEGLKLKVTRKKEKGE